MFCHQKWRRPFAATLREFTSDTHVVLWWLVDDALLQPAARDAIRDQANVVYVSAATAWEISIKKALGKLDSPDDLANTLELNNFHPLEITVAHATMAGTLPRHHDDPFDRMLIAQAQAGQLTLVTHDGWFRAYGVAVIWTWAARSMPSVLMHSSDVGPKSIF